MRNSYRYRQTSGSAIIRGYNREGSVAVINNIRKITLALGLAYLAFLLHSAIWRTWFGLFIEKRIFTDIAGINTNLLVEQIPVMIIFFLLGIAAYFIFDSKLPHLWPISAGLVDSLMRVLLNKTSLTVNADIADKINFFLTYAYPPLFAFLGAYTADLLSRRRVRI
jgi:hypothetical protein